MQAAVEISLYPLDAAYIDNIKAFIARLNAHSGLTVQTNAMSTQIFGPLDRVMGMLAKEMESAAQSGPRLVFVMKVIPGLAPK
ncbi:MAG: thiamine-binding protein [Proteobacteria bacterium]|nr:thiamine-binding protein [Pseudomonadota bacterium]